MDETHETPVWATDAARTAHPVLALEASLILPAEELLGEALAHRGPLRLVVTQAEQREHADRLWLLRERSGRTLSVHPITP